MATCRKCGAYIPDGKTKCLACGFDSAEQHGSQTAQAEEKYSSYEYGFGANPDSAARQRQKEEALRWAQEQRERMKQTMSENAAYPHMTKLFAALSYINILFLIPLVFMRDDSVAVFHAKQGARLFLFNAIATALGGITALIPVLAGLFSLYCMVCGIRSAAEGVCRPLPYIGTWFAGLFR